MTYKTSLRLTRFGDTPWFLFLTSLCPATVGSNGTDPPTQEGGSREVGEGPLRNPDRRERF